MNFSGHMRIALLLLHWLLRIAYSRLRHGYDGSGKGGGRYGGAGSGGGRAGAVIINGAGGNDGSGGGQLEQLRRELEAEREKNDSLMHAFLPRSVADQLRRGQVPQGGI